MFGTNSGVLDILLTFQWLYTILVDEPSASNNRESLGCCFDLGTSEKCCSTLVPSLMFVIAVVCAIVVLGASKFLNNGEAVV
jgi:hypothetical protein